MERTPGRGRNGTEGTRRRHHLRRIAPTATLLVAVVGAVAARRQAPWIPWMYLGALFVLVVTIWLLVRRGPSGRLRTVAITVAAALIVALAPVPWMTAGLDEPPGTAWRLDGRLHVDGERIDPAGEWYWLTVGRPPLVAEVVRSWFGDAPAPQSMRDAGVASSPKYNEPAAVAAGLQAAGRSIGFDLLVELSDPVVPTLPDRLVVAELNGIEPTDRDAWQRALDTLDTAAGADSTIVGVDGAAHRIPGSVVPYRRVELLDVPLRRFDAVIGGRLARTPPGQWFRGLALGRSHGLMVALVTYAHTSGEDLARGRVIAGTGSINGDGTVGRIGGLRSKARAAVDLGADVLFVPDEQLHLLAGLDLGRTIVVGVVDLTEAVEALRDPALGEPLGVAASAGSRPADVHLGD